ncbi:peptidoglycan-binding domain-containing protein [Mangrovitalea sediminis]|uniref:peptidoglycan-binding domain-containing protein n=1 Tax=Mangrovitalea sediminis TaxID=1982043 RepID=UPI000BE4C732|nr:peptidoglycan-binding domain-containing protein [Mangrovitalea sediminis]
MTFKQQKHALTMAVAGILFGTLTMPASAEPSKQEIFAAQNALYGAGFDIGKADGMMGSTLHAAIKKFQESQSGLQATGDLDGATLAALGVSEGGGSTDSMAATAPAATKQAAPAVVTPKPVAEKPVQATEQPKAAEKPKKKEEHHWWNF